jgi:hypothetical protein
MSHRKGFDLKSSQPNSKLKFNKLLMDVEQLTETINFRPLYDLLSLLFSKKRNMSCGERRD